MALRAAFVSLLLAATGVTAAPATTEPPANHAPAVAFHAEGLGVPILALRGGMQLLQGCEARFRDQCPKHLRNAASSGKWTLRYFDTFTLFPERFEKNPAESVASYLEFRKLVRETNEALVSASLVYDYNLFARYGATLRVCPPSNAGANLEFLANLKPLDLRTFGELGPEEYSAALEAIDQEEQRLIAIVRRWPAEKCTAAGEVGFDLLKLMYSKLQPWMDKTAEPGLDPVRAAAADFLFRAAAELERRVNPDMKTKWRAITAEQDASRPR